MNNPPHFLYTYAFLLVTDGGPGVRRFGKMTNFQLFSAKILYKLPT